MWRNFSLSMFLFYLTFHYRNGKKTDLQLQRQSLHRKTKGKNEKENRDFMPSSGSDSIKMQSHKAHETFFLDKSARDFLQRMNTAARLQLLQYIDSNRSVFDTNFLKYRASDL